DHAALAWRTLRWILAGDADGAICVRVAEVFAAERERWARAEDAGDASAAATGHGLLPRGDRVRALARAWDDVIAPAWGSLPLPGRALPRPRRPRVRGAPGPQRAPAGHARRGYRGRGPRRRLPAPGRRGRLRRGPREAVRHPPRRAQRRRGGLRAPVEVAPAD